MSGPARRSGEDGYTLIEVMVVVFIIGLMTAVVGLNMRQGPAGVKERAAALALAVNRAGREAIVSGQTIALGLRDGQPIFQRRRAGKWMDEPALLPLSQGADGNRLEVSGAVNSPRSGFPAASADDQVQRVAWFSPLGEATPVELLVIGADGSAAVRVETNGRARVLDSREETSDVRSLGR